MLGDHGPGHAGHGHGARHHLGGLGWFAVVWATMMAALFALGVMNVAWMIVVAALVAIEKLLPWDGVAIGATVAFIIGPTDEPRSKCSPARSPSTVTEPVCRRISGIGQTRTLGAGPIGRPSHARAALPGLASRRSRPSGPRPQGRPLRPSPEFACLLAHFIRRGGVVAQWVCPRIIWHSGVTIRSCAARSVTRSPAYVRGPTSIAKRSS